MSYNITISVPQTLSVISVQWGCFDNVWLRTYFWGQREMRSWLLLGVVTLSQSQWNSFRSKSMMQPSWNAAAILWICDLNSLVWWCKEEFPWKGHAQYSLCPPTLRWFPPIEPVIFSTSSVKAHTLNLLVLAQTKRYVCTHLFLILLLVHQNER